MLFRENLEEKYRINTNKFSEWEDFSEAIKKGRVVLKLKYNTNIFKQRVLNRDNNVFFQGILSIKYIVALIWIATYLIINRDFYFLLILPLLFLINIVIELNFVHRTLVMLLAICIVIFSGIYFNLNWNYYVFTSIMIFLNTMSHKIYDDFLADNLSDLEYMFMDAVEEGVITKIVIK